MNVICINKVYVDGHPIDVYQVGNIYRSVYSLEKMMVSDSVVIEFEWIVYCSETNHYQFTEEDFKKYFIDVSQNRDNKISQIFNI